MAVALSLLFEGAAADAVRAVWAALAEAGESRDMLELQYPPHLTLMVAEDEGFMPILVERFAGLAPLVPDALGLDEVRQFEGTSVTWVSCGDDPGLGRLHAAAAGLLPADAIHPHYRPGVWTPHVTLALKGKAQSLLDRARAEWTKGVPARISRLEVARFPPAETLVGIDLCGI